MAETPFYDKGGYSPLDILNAEYEKAKASGKKGAVDKAVKRAVQQAQQYAKQRDELERHIAEGRATPEMWADPRQFIDPKKVGVGGTNNPVYSSIRRELLDEGRELTPEEWLQLLNAAASEAKLREVRAKAAPIEAGAGRYFDAMAGGFMPTMMREVQEKYGSYSTGNKFVDAATSMAGQVTAAYMQAMALAPVSGAAVGGLAKAVPAVKTAAEAIPKVGKYILPAAQRALTGAGRVGLRSAMSAPEDRASGRQYAAAALMGAVDAAAEPMIGEALTKAFPAISPYLERPLAAAGSSVITSLAAKPVSGQSWQEFKAELLPDIIADSLMSSIGLLNPEERRQAFEDRAVRMIYPEAIKAGKSKVDAKAAQARYAETLKDAVDFTAHPEEVTPELLDALTEMQFQAHVVVDSLKVPDKLKANMTKYIDDRMDGLREKVGTVKPAAIAPEPEARLAEEPVPEPVTPEVKEAEQTVPPVTPAEEAVVPKTEEPVAQIKGTDEEVAQAEAEVRAELAAQAWEEHPPLWLVIKRRGGIEPPSVKGSASADWREDLNAIGKRFPGILRKTGVKLDELYNDPELVAAGYRFKDDNELMAALLEESRRPKGSWKPEKAKKGATVQPVAQDEPVAEAGKGVVEPAPEVAAVAPEPITEQAGGVVPSPPPKSGAEAARAISIKEALDLYNRQTDIPDPDDGKYYLRWDEREYEPGDSLPESRRWDDGSPTDELLPGTSVIDPATKGWSRYDLMRAYYGNLYLVEGDYGTRHGEDVGEIILPNARVVRKLASSQPATAAGQHQPRPAAAGLADVPAPETILPTRPDLSTPEGRLQHYRSLLAERMNTRQALKENKPNLSGKGIAYATNLNENDIEKLKANIAKVEAEIAAKQAPAPAVPEAPAPIASVEPAAPTRPSLREELLGLETKADKTAEDNTRLEQLRSLIRVDMSQLRPGMGVKLNVDGTVKPGWRIVETNPDTRDVLVRDVAKQTEPDQWIPANKLIPDYKYNGPPPAKEQPKPPPTGTASEVQGAPRGLPPNSPIAQRAASASGVVQPITRAELLRLMESNLNTAIRTGHLHNPKHAGEYYTRQGDIRLRGAGDMDTAAHEIGHHVTKLMGLTSALPEIQQLGARIYPKATADVQENEGIAEFFRMYFTRPQDAQAQAPTFYAQLEQRLSQDPTMNMALRRVQDGYRRLYEQDDFAKSESMLARTKPEPTPLLSKKEQWAARAIDDIAGIEKAVRLLTEPGTSIPADEDPVTLARAARSSTARAELILYEAMVDPEGNTIGPSLKQRLAPVSKNPEKRMEFEHYLVAQRGKWLREQHPDHVMIGEPEPGFFDKRIAELDAKYPEFRQVAASVYEWSNQLLEHLVDSGMMSRDLADKLINDGLFYVPLYRAFEPDEMRDGAPVTGGGKNFADLPSPTHAIKGSSRPIIPPLESLVKNAYYFMSLADRNRVGRAFAQLEEKSEGMGWLITKIDAPIKASEFNLEDSRTALRKALADAGYSPDMLDNVDLDQMVQVFAPMGYAGRAQAQENILTVWKNGKREFYWVHPDLYTSLKSLDAQQAHFLVRALQPFATALRMGATLTPDFATRNPIRDQWTAMVFSKTGYNPLDLVRGVASVIKKDDLYRQWVASGGAQSTMMSLNREGLQRGVAELMGEKYGSVAKRGVRAFVEKLQRAGEIGEQATRLGEFGRALKWDVSNATRAEKMKAAAGTRDVTIDFSRAGTHTRVMNQIMAFLNADIQGTDKLLRSFKEDPKGTTLRGFLYITVPTLINYALTYDDERRKQLPAWRKMLFWNVPVGGKLIPIPKPFGLGLLFGSSIEAFLDYVQDKDPQAIKDWAQSAAEGTIPNLLPTALVPIVEVWANRSTFTGGKIVPTAEEEFLKPGLAHEAYGPQTSEFAKLLGDFINVSPRKIEHVIRGYTGGMGQHALDLVDLMWGGALLEKKSPAEYIPGVKAFVVDPYKSTQAVNRFYDELYQLEAEKRRYNERARTDGRKVKEPDEARLKLLRAAKKEIDAQQAYIKDTQWDKNLSPTERKRRITAAQFVMTNIALLSQGKEAIAVEDSGLGFNPYEYSAPPGYKRQSAATSTAAAASSVQKFLNKYIK